MNQDLKKFEDLLKSDAEFQKKMQVALQAYTGEVNEKAIFDNIMVPLGKEYGLSATFEEYVEYLKGIERKTADLSPDELAQVSGGGKGWGDGINLCYGPGVGIGKTDDGFCVLGGAGGTGACVVKGIATDW